MAALSFLLAIFVLVYFSAIQSPYESQICQSSKDSRERTTDMDSGISDNNINGVTSPSSSTSSLVDQSGSSITANETTPLLMSRSFDEREGRNINIPTYRYNTAFDNSFGSFPDILKTVCITGAGAVEV